MRCASHDLPPLLLQMKWRGQRLLRWLVGLLVLALLVGNHAALQTQSLGRLHGHHDAALSPTASSASPLLAPLMSVVHRLQALRELAHAQTRASAPPASLRVTPSYRIATHDEAKPHRHGLFERHHHAPGDASVQAQSSDGVDAASSGHDGANPSAAGAALGPISDHSPRPAAERRHGWHTAPAPHWRNTHPTPLDRPPSA